MAESEARDWVLVWVKICTDEQEVSVFWKEEQQQIDLGTCSLILYRSLWEVRLIYRLPQWHEN